MSIALVESCSTAAITPTTATATTACSNPEAKLSPMPRRICRSLASM